MIGKSIIMEIGTILVDAAGIYTAREANKLSKQVNAIELSNIKPVLFINSVALEQDKPTEDITSGIMFDINNLLEEGEPVYDTLILRLENKGNCIINSIECKKIVIFAGNEYDLEANSGADGWEFIASEPKKQRVKLLQNTEAEIFILAENENANCNNKLNIYIK